ncbi:MAG: hypothetical protein WC223_12545 [Bacteroidales bacterium]|jgi:hypothetical protein
MAKWQIIRQANKQYIYVSKDGNNTDADNYFLNNPGQTNNETVPYATINAAINRMNTDSRFTSNSVNIIWGSGKWNEILTGTRNKGLVYFIFDGKVIIDGTQNAYCTFTQSDILISNSFRANFIYDIDKYIGNVGTSFKMINIEVEGGILITGQNQYLNFERCVFKNCYFNSPYYWNDININANKCIFFTSRSGSGGYAMNFKNNIVKDSVMKITGFSYQSDYNDFVGTINYQGNQRNLLWVQQNTNTNFNSKNIDPGFLDEAKGCYYLRADSPLLNAGKDCDDIGPYNKGFLYNAWDLWNNRNVAGCFNVDYINNIVMQNTGVKRARFWSGVIDFGSQVKLDIMQMIAAINYNDNGKADKFIDSECKNFPLYNPNETWYIGDTCTYENTKYRCRVDETTGVFNPANWDIVTANEYNWYADFRFRCSKISASDCLAQQHQSFIVNAQMKTDNSGRGTADDNYVLSEGRYVVTRFLEFIIDFHDLTI